MEKRKLGMNPAFPSNGLCNSRDIYQEGMTARFYAACAITQGMLAHPRRYKCRHIDSHLSWKEGMVKEAYELADELLNQEYIVLK